jgi:hypothetical protein
LFVLFCLPQNIDEWLTLTEDQLVLRKCSYWIILTDAEPCEGGKTIHIPKTNVLSVEKLKEIVQIYSDGEVIRYEP